MLAAAEAGVDAADAAIDALSGITSQPPLGSIVAALQHHERDTGLDLDAVRDISTYWEGVRRLYAGFESDLRAGTAEVYLHEMPGGQVTNLRAQARALGLEERWPEVARTYADVNAMFGDIIKVTPTSKVVGDMALAMVSAGLSRADVENPEIDVAFPDSVVGLMRGDIGQPPGGFPQALQKKVLKGAVPITVRPGAQMEPIDLEASRGEAEAEMTGITVDDEDLCSYLMYPKVYLDYMGRRRDFGPVRVLPTPTFFHGMAAGEGNPGRPAPRRHLGDPPASDFRARREGRGQTVLRVERARPARSASRTSAFPPATRVPSRRTKPTPTTSPPRCPVSSARSPWWRVRRSTPATCC